MSAEPAAKRALPILGLHGAPRSGTTWLGQIFNSSPHTAYRFQPFFAFAFRARVDAARTPQALEAILDDVAATQDDYILQRGDAALAQELRFPKQALTRLVYKEVRYHHLLPQLLRIPRFQGIGIVRDPIDVIASWIRAPREFRPGWDLAAEWRSAPSKNQGRLEEFYGYERWKAAAVLFEALQSEAPARFRVVGYQQLVRDPLGEVAGLFQFAGLPFDAQVRAFLARSSSTDDDDTYGVLRSGGGRGDNRDVPDDIRRAIHDDLRGTPLEKHLRPTDHRRPA